VGREEVEIRHRLLCDIVSALARNHLDLEGTVLPLGPIITAFDCTSFELLRYPVSERRNGVNPRS
jgi:hypothetical protein